MEPAAQDTGAGLSVNQAKSKLQGILSEPTTPTDRPNAEPPAAQPEGSSPDTQPTDRDTKDSSRRRKAKLGDTEVEFEILTDGIDPDLVPKGLMMERKYRNDTKALAAQRREFESQKSKFDERLAELQDIVMFDAKQLESDDFKELKETDPSAYWSKFESIKGRAEKLKEFRDARDQELLEKQKQLVEAEQNKYTDAIPEWLDDSKKEEDIAKMSNFLEKSGFSRDEMGGIYDSRIMAIVRKAALFDEISAQNIDDKKVKLVPKSAKPSASQPSNERSARQDAVERAKKTGSRHDAQSAIKQLLFGG